MKLSFENVIADPVVINDKEFIRHILESSGYMYNFIGIRRYQKDNNLKPTGILNLETANHIKENHFEAGKNGDSSFKIYKEDHIEESAKTFEKENIEV